MNVGNARKHFRLEHAEHVRIIAVTVNRESRVGRVLHRGDVLFERRVCIQPDDPVARHHHRIRHAIAETHHAIHHLALIRIDDALLMAFRHEQSDFLFTDRLRLIVLDSNETQKRTVNRTQRQHNRLRGSCKSLQRDGNARCNFLRVRQRQALRNQLAENHLRRRNRSHCSRESNRPRVIRGIRPKLRQVIRNELPECFTTKQTGQNPNQRNADLHRREKVVRIIGKVERNLCAAARLRHLFQAQLTRSHERHFGHGKKAIQQNQRGNNEKL